MSLPQARFPRQAPSVMPEVEVTAVAPRMEVTADWRSAVKSTESTRLRTIVAVLFGLATAVFLIVTGWAAVWATQSLQPLGAGLALIALGLSITTGYEAWTVRPGSQQRTLSEIANAAFMAHRFIWVGVYLGILLIAGLLTMHFTRLVQPDWVLLAAGVLAFVNGALIAYWFEWLP